MIIKPHHKQIILEILAKYPYHFYAFGSRVTGKAKEFSDLDLCFTDDIPLNILSAIEEDFEESNLPYTVDIVNLNRCDESFKKIIQKDMTLI